MRLRINLAPPIATIGFPGSALSSLIPSGRSASKTLCQEVAFGQDAQMVLYGLTGDVEVLGNGVGGHCMHGDQNEDRSSGGGRNGLKNVASHECEY